MAKKSKYYGCEITPEDVVRILNFMQVKEKMQVEIGENQNPTEDDLQQSLFMGLDVKCIYKGDEIVLNMASVNANFKDVLDFFSKTDKYLELYLDNYFQSWRERFTMFLIITNKYCEYARQYVK